jgi:hypothetical protein
VSLNLLIITSKCNIKDIIITTAEPAVNK